MKIDFCYVINLNSEDCVDRIKQVPFHTLTKYYVMDAINGWDIVNKPSKSPFKYKAADWWKIDSNVDFWNREVTPGEIGCSLSH